MKPQLNPDEQDRMDEILEIANRDGVLSLWITQVDHFVAHKLEHLDPHNKEQLEDQVAWLREYLETRTIP